MSKNNYNWTAFKYFSKSCMKKCWRIMHTCFMNDPISIKKHKIRFFLFGFCKISNTFLNFFEFFYSFLEKVLTNVLFGREQVLVNTSFKQWPTLYFFKVSKVLEKLKYKFAIKNIFFIESVKNTKSKRKNVKNKLLWAEQSLLASITLYNK